MIDSARMIVESIQIEGFRGIRRGLVEGLGPLTVIVGRNSSGKSTILEALLIATAPNLPEAVGRVGMRRWDGDDSVRWLFDGGDRSLTPSLLARVGLLPWNTELVSETPDAVFALRHVLGAKARNPPTGIDYLRVNRTQFFPDGRFQSQGGPPRAIRIPLDALPIRTDDAPVPFAKLVDPSRDVGSLAKLFESLYTDRHDKLAIEIMKSMIPGLEEIRPLTSGVLMLLFPNGSHPIAVQGDGAKVLARTTFELAAPKGSLVLVEEPEAHLHPGALRLVARVLRESVARQVQVVLTTHSLELIDEIVRALQENPIDATKPLDPLRVVRTTLRDGQLHAAVVPGADVAFAREEMHEDLR